LGIYFSFLDEYFFQQKLKAATNKGNFQVMAAKGQDLHFF